ncbi:MAG: thiol-disulfide oxidoreductase DCC family protein [Arenicellales bacterium]
MITIFFDGKCSLCRREISHYKKIAPAGAFDWVDVTVNSDALAALGISQADALRALHARGDDGVLSSGVDAFIVLWRALPRWRWLASLVGLPGIRFVADNLYEKFADYRFSRLAHCQAALSTDA